MTLGDGGRTRESIETWLTNDGECWGYAVKVKWIVGILIRLIFATLAAPGPYGCRRRQERRRLEPWSASPDRRHVPGMHPHRAHRKNYPFSFPADDYYISRLH